MVIAIVSAFTLAPAADGSAISLAWPESKQEIPAGGEVSLGEFFAPGVPWCEANGKATIVADGESTDSLTAKAPPAWYECKTRTVTGGFTSMSFTQHQAHAVAEPPISISEPGGCVYQLAAAEAHESLAGRAIYEFTATATLAQGTPCAPTLAMEGQLGIYAPLSGGIGLVSWAEFAETIRQRQEREARERREHEEAVKREHAEVLTWLGGLAPPRGTAAKLGRLVKANGATIALTAPVAGTLTVRWYELPKGAALPAVKRPIELAHGAVTLTKGAHAKLRIFLTRSGRKLFEHKRRVIVTAKESFTPANGEPATVVKQFALKR